MSPPNARMQAPLWFLFLTDLHVKGDDTSQQRSTLRELMEEIRRVTLDKHIDFVVIAGDLAYSGKAEEYRHVSEQIIRPIKQMLREDVPIFATPGNHDLDCDIALPIQWGHLGKSRREKFFGEDPEGQQIRTSRSACFSNWEAFLQENTIIAARPSLEVTRAHIIDLGQKGKVQIFSTNTALFSDKEPDTQNHEVPAPNPSVRAAFQSRDTFKDTHNILVGHHPIDTFTYQQQQVFKRLLSDHHAIYLHGHTHVMQATLGGDGLLSLGLSAGYVTTADATPVPIYRNGFALAAIHDGLHVLLRQWNNESGAWEPASGLPVEFQKPSDLIQDGCKFPLRQSHVPPSETVDTMQFLERTSPQITTIRTLSSFTPQDLLEITRSSHVLPDIPSEPETRRIESTLDTLIIETDEGDNRQRFSFISATGHVLSQEAVERINNDIDYDDLTAYTIVSVGHLAGEAKISYLRLKRRKPITIIAQNDLAQLLLRSLDQKATRKLARFDAATTEGEILASGQQICVLLCDRRQMSWFIVLCRDGTYLDGDSEMVRALRHTVPRLAFSEYGHPDVQLGTQSLLQPSVFDTREYLTKCHTEHNSVRYAALATFGLRLSNTSLEELYITASADCEQTAASETGLRRALEEALQGLGIKDPAVRAQMEAQINRRLRGQGTVETGVARKLYQRFGTVIVLGDPGSGKTLFAKYEMLAYCEETGEADSWYRHHIPVYIPLAEAARSHNWDNEFDVIEALSIMCGRQGLRFPIQHLIEHDSNGRLAIFFDGLDEIVSLDQRIAIFEKVCLYSLRAKSRGNRIIITSRPAAVRMLSIPETFRLITLRGLTSSEMRELARRILSTKVSESGVDLTLEPGEGPADESLVETLIQDCQRIPGIGRIARNPLLFTLLTMIYANHGPLAAKRHRVYQQAVQTLASARARSAGQRILSEADLRHRLGAVALEAYQSPQTVVPSWNQVYGTVRRVMEQERGDVVDDTAVEAFIQQVAEATGLLVLHPSVDREDGGNITFMHQSFMEYYAAVGISEMEDYVEFASMRSADARWKEILVLLAGIVGDRSDVTPLIVSIFSSGAAAEKYTLDRLVFAFECALETDVPPERTQQALVQAVELAFNGVLLYDDNLRRSIGTKLAELHQSVAQGLVEDLLVRGLKQEAPHVVAAYMDVLGHIARNVEIGSETVDAFVAATAHKDSFVLVAALNAIAESEQLRIGDHVDRLLGSGFRGSIMAKYAAVQAVEKEPSLANSVWRSLMEMIRGDKEYLAVRAANAVIRAGWKVTINDEQSSGEVGQQRADLLTALSVLARVGDDRAVIGAGDSVPRERVEFLLSSTEEETFLLGVHLLPWVSRSEQFVHDRLMAIVTADRSHRVVAAGLDAIRMSYDAQGLMDLKDLDAVRRKLRDTHRDVRMAACRLLGEFCGDEIVVKAIMDYGTTYASSPIEYRGAVTQLGGVAHDTAEHALVVNYLDAQMGEFLDRGDHNSERPLRSIQALLESASAAGAMLSAGNVRRLRDLHGDFRVEPRLRRSVVSHFGDIAPMSEQSARFLVERTRHVPADLMSDHFESMQRFLSRCSRKVASIRSVQLELESMQRVILERLEVILRQSPRGHQNTAVSSGRRALSAIAKMESMYNDVATQSVCDT